MPTVSAGANSGVSAFGSDDTLTITTSHGVTGRWVFTPTQTGATVKAGIAGSFGPKAESLSFGPWGVPGNVIVYNDSTSPAGVTWGQGVTLYQCGNLNVYGNLSAFGAVSATAANFSVTLSPTGTGTVTIAPATTQGVIDNMVLGNSVRAPAGVTSFFVTGSDASGTPGNVTVNNNKGRVAIAAGSNNVVVTCNRAATNCAVFAVIAQATADATLTQIVRTVCGATSFTIYGNANATANTVVDFLLIGN